MVFKKGHKSIKKGEKYKMEEEQEDNDTDEDANNDLIKSLEIRKPINKEENQEPQTTEYYHSAGDKRELWDNIKTFTSEITTQINNAEMENKEIDEYNTKEMPKKEESISRVPSSKNLANFLEVTNFYKSKVSRLLYCLNRIKASNDNIRMRLR
jgi:endonuclease III-like uncharacterized protein